MSSPPPTSATSVTSPSAPTSTRAFPNYSGKTSAASSPLRARAEVSVVGQASACQSERSSERQARCRCRRPHVHVEVFGERGQISVLPIGGNLRWKTARHKGSTADGDRKSVV